MAPKKKVLEGFFQIQLRLPGAKTPKTYMDFEIDDYVHVGSNVPTIEYNVVDDFVDSTVLNPHAWGLDRPLGRMDIVCLMYRGRKPTPLLIIDPELDRGIIMHRSLTIKQKEYFGSGKTNLYFWKIPVSKDWTFFMGKRSI